MPTAGDTRFKDDWNVNNDYLMYVMSIIKRMGYYRAVHDPYGWYDTAAELQCMIGGIINQELAGLLAKRLAAIDEKLNKNKGMAIGFAGRKRLERRHSVVFTMLDKYTHQAVKAIHQARLILPKADLRFGIKKLAEEYGLKEEGEKEEVEKE